MRQQVSDVEVYQSLGIQNFEGTGSVASHEILGFYVSTDSNFEPRWIQKV